MTYVTGDLPVGLYDRTSLSNVGIGHYVLDGGVGYTYFNPATGHEFSVVGGLINNFINPYTNYQNGVDFQVHSGASQFLAKQILIGAVGYVYNHHVGDSGSGATASARSCRASERGVCQLDGDLFQIASELERHLIILADWRVSVFADVQCLIRRNAERNGALDPALGYQPPVDH
jgi:hypothetical protein